MVISSGNNIRKCKVYKEDIPLISEEKYPTLNIILAMEGNKIDNLKYVTDAKFNFNKADSYRKYAVLRRQLG